MNQEKSRSKRLKRANFLEKIPEGAILCARPSRWGNPFSVDVFGRITSINLYKKYIVQKIMNEPEKYNLDQLRGHDLVCYCNLDEPCHVDFLLYMLDNPQKVFPPIFPIGGIVSENDESVEIGEPIITKNVLNRFNEFIKEINDADFNKVKVITDTGQVDYNAIHKAMSDQLREVEKFIKEGRVTLPKKESPEKL